MATIQELAREVDKAQAALDRARQTLLAALGTTPGSRNTRVRPSRSPGGESIAARVLSLVQGAGAVGIQRQAIIQQLGPENEPAITSALKKHSQTKKMKSDGDGLWKALARAVPVKGGKADPK